MALPPQERPASPRPGTATWAARPDQFRATGALAQPEAPPQPVPFWTQARRGLSAGFDNQMVNGNLGGREAAWTGALRERHRRIEYLTGTTLPWMQGMEGSTEFGADQPTDIDPYSADASLRRSASARAVTEAEYEARLDALRARYPQLAEIPTLSAYRQSFEGALSQTAQRAGEASSQGVGGAVGAFVGGVGGSVFDPVNLTTALVSGGTAPAGRTLLQNMLRSGATNMAVEVASVPQRSVEARVYGGPEYTGEDAVLDVVTAGVMGAGFEGAGALLKLGFREARTRLATSPDAGDRGLGHAIEGYLSDETALDDALDFDTARDALNSGGPRPIEAPDQDLSGLFGGEAFGPPSPRVTGGDRLSQPTSAVAAVTEVDYRGRSIFATRFDPLALEVDAARFQYKAGGDVEGVTNRLRDVGRWDPTASGKIMVWEDAAGRQFVVDGHQRRGLAARLSREGWEGTELDGYLLREADGWTAREARVMAAAKNLREGSGSILDAARLFREAPGLLTDRSLPMSGELIGQARHLAVLDDAAFRAVGSGVIPERYGAVIGELAADRPDMHADLVELLRQADPRTIDGARALVHEAKLDDFIATEGVQQDLFGGLPRQATLVARGRIREWVMSALRRDERLFGLLVRNADAIEAGGNMLARDANAASQAVDRTAAAIFSRLSLTDGPMTEALQAAARSVTLNEMKVPQAGKPILDQLRRAIQDGEAVNLMRGEMLNPPAPSPTALAAANDFAEPGGRGQQAQIAPKPEDVEIESGAAEPGLFDDLTDEAGHLDRAIEHLRACAPGRAGGGA